MAADTEKASNVKEGLTYADAGVDIDNADAAKRDMAKVLSSTGSRVLNGVGAFASLFDIHQYPEISEPVLVIKMEEPGSKQLLAAQHDRLPGVGYDLVNHLINDTIMVGAVPLAIQDTIVCGQLERETVVQLVAAMADAARRQGCELVGGETSEQPKVLPSGSYILSACCVGLVDRKRVIDGSKIAEGDRILAIASNGVHTNGYTLIRELLEKEPQLADAEVGGEPFIDQLLKPHLCYNTPLQTLFREDVLHGMAHITGGGVKDNLARIIPEGLQAGIDLACIEPLAVFRFIREQGNVPDDDMFRTFNCGVGAIAVAPQEAVERVQEVFTQHHISVYPIGEVEKGTERIALSGALPW